MYGRTAREQAEYDLCFMPLCPDNLCWFCHLPLKQGQTNYHHLVAQRYIRRGILSQDMEVCVPAHSFWHALWHAKHDNGWMKWPLYRLAMHDRNYGYGIFAQSRWLKKGRTPQQLSSFWVPYHPRAA